MSRLKILVADDSRTIRTLVRGTLRDAGYDVDTVPDGNQAVLAAQRECPDLFILDIQMPYKDGYAACAELIALGAPWNRVPFLFLSRIEANALEALGRELGAYLTKPVEPSLLLNTVASLLHQSADDHRSLCGPLH